MKLTLTLPDALHDRYEADAAKVGVSLNTYIKDRLEATADYSYRPLVVSPDERREMEMLLDQQVGSGRQLVDVLKRCLTIDLGEADISLTLDQLSWLEQLAQGNGLTLSEYMSMQVPEFVDFLTGR